jgi:hypothetical protein
MHFIHIAVSEMKPYKVMSNFKFDTKLYVLLLIHAGHNAVKESVESYIMRPEMRKLCVVFLLLFLCGGCRETNTTDSFSIHSGDRIQPYSGNPHYLAWGDVPVFPLGPAGYHSWTPVSRPGTVDFIKQMDRLAAVIDEINSPHVLGFMRSLPYDPMNHLHDGPVERVLQPWIQLDDGRYDLMQFEPDWEERFLNYLDAALDRRIVIAVEIWDDWSVTRGPGGEYDPGEGAAWNAHPFNPDNNINYGEETLPLETAVCNAPFYSTIPSRNHINSVLELQKRYVDKVLEIVSDYPNVIINISNESRAHLDWSRFWAAYIGERVPENMMIGEMPSTNRIDGGGECDYDLNPLTLSTEPGYSYVDAAQGVSGHEFGGAREQAIRGGKRLHEYRLAMAEAETIRPLIVSKDYTRGPDGGDIVLWSRFAGGAAAARFHRLGEGHGPEISEFQHHAAGRLGTFIADVPFWNMHPAPDLVDDLPETADANVLAAADGTMVIQMVGGNAGESFLLRLEPGRWTLRWMNPSKGSEIERFEITAEAKPLTVYIPGDSDHRVLHVKP